MIGQNRKRVTVCLFQRQPLNFPLYVIHTFPLQDAGGMGTFRPAFVTVPPVQGEQKRKVVLQETTLVPRVTGNATTGCCVMPYTANTSGRENTKPKQPQSRWHALRRRAARSPHPSACQRCRMQNRAPTRKSPVRLIQPAAPGESGKSAR